MARKLTYKETVSRLNGAHYHVDGQPIASIHAVFQIAKDRGFDGALATIRKRLEAGLNTWDEIARPVAENRNASIVGSRKRAATEKEQMAKLIAEIDARKKALAEATTPEGWGADGEEDA